MVLGYDLQAAHPRWLLSIARQTSKTHEYRAMLTIT